MDEWMDRATRWRRGRAACGVRRATAQQQSPQSGGHAHPWMTTVRVHLLLSGYGAPTNDLAALLEYVGRSTKLRQPEPPPADLVDAESDPSRPSSVRVDSWILLSRSLPLLSLAEPNVFLCDRLNIWMGCSDE
jgi:hypothetical protein